MKTVLMILALMILSASSIAIAREDVEAPKTCQRCRMDRTMFAHSRMLVHYADGVIVGVCSINCAIEEITANKEKPVNKLLVADYNSKMLADASTVTWVVGGSRQGVMTALPKWAFIRQEDALEFMKENGGQVMPLEKVLAVTRDEVLEMAADMTILPD